MERYQKPDHLELEMFDTDSTDKWRHWRQMLEGFITAILLSLNKTLRGTDKFIFLLHHVSTPIYRNLSLYDNYETSVGNLVAMFFK